MRVRHSGPPVSFHPAMLAKVTDPAGKPVMIHKTYLTMSGTKATVEQPRMFCPGNIPARQRSPVSGAGRRPRGGGGDRDGDRSREAVPGADVGGAERLATASISASERTGIATDSVASDAAAASADLRNGSA
jgi:hypothetical protein